MYTEHTPDPGETLVQLARRLGCVVCHRADYETLRATGLPVSVLTHGGPQPGHLWAAL